MKRCLPIALVVLGLLPATAACRSSPEPNPRDGTKAAEARMLVRHEGLPKRWIDPATHLTLHNTAASCRVSYPNMRCVIWNWDRPKMGHDVVRIH